MRISGRIHRQDAVCDLEIVDGRIASILPVPDSPARAAAEEIHLSPGFIDLQLNGFNGVDYNDSRTIPEQIIESARAVHRTGITAFCPTVITGSREHMTACIRNLILASEQSPGFARAMIGIHIEGPYISMEDGPRGAHPRQYARPPDWEEFQSWQDAAEGRIRIVTLAPEWPGSLPFIERAAGHGVIVAIGHTAATPGQIADAVKAGAKMSTHLGNGSHAKIDRHPNYIWEQLANDELWASFIVDGHHLPPSVVKCFFRGKGFDRSILVTDAIAAAGRPAGRYRLGEVEVEVSQNRRVSLPGTPYLAGSVLEMPEAIGNAVRFSDATLDQALRMATENPARLLGCLDERGTLEPGRRADVVRFKWNETESVLEIDSVIVNGERMDAQSP